MDKLSSLSDSDSHWQLTDSQWRVLEGLFAPQTEKRGRGQPRANMKEVVNTVLFVHCTQRKWEAIPQGEGWAKKTTANRWMQKWKESDLFNKILSQIEQVAPEVPQHPVSVAVFGTP